MVSPRRNPKRKATAIVDLTNSDDDEADEREWPSDIKTFRTGLVPLTGDWTSYARQFAEILMDPQSEAVVVHPVRTIGLQSRYLARLLNRTRWLNDEVINAWGELVTTAGNAAEGEGLFLWLGTFYWPALKQIAGKGLPVSAQDQQRLTKPLIGADGDVKSILNANTIFMPVFDAERSHWTMCTVRPGARTVSFWDSLAGKNNAQQERQSCAQGRPTMRWWLMHILGESKDDWRWGAKRGPQQNDAVSCGPIICTITLYICMRLLPEFDASEMPERRAQMAAVLLSKGFDQEVKWGTKPKLQVGD